MSKEVWLVVGNKGCVGKSVVSKLMCEWYRYQGSPFALADGDPEGDVDAAYASLAHTSEVFDLSTNMGWADFTDWICLSRHNFPIIANLPDAVTEKTIQALDRYKPSVDDLGFRTRVIFVINTLPDGLTLLPKMRKLIRSVYVAKNLFFGANENFAFYNRRYGRHFDSIYIPRLQPHLMNETRAAELPFSAVARARPDQPVSSVLARLSMAEWLESAYLALEEGFEGAQYQTL